MKYLLLLLLLLTSCSGRINPEQYKLLNKVCKTNDGVKYIDVHAISSADTEVLCNNGVGVKAGSFKEKNESN